MKKLIVTLALVTGMYSLNFAQTTQKLVVHITQIKSNVGNIGVAIFNSKESFLGKPFMKATKKAKKGEMTFTFDVPAGTYSISVMHDENKNGKLDKNFMGIPSEPYGISLEGRNMFGPPSYDEAKFMVKDKDVKLSIEVK